jgi:hypothetical protein
MEHTTKTSLHAMPQVIFALLYGLPFSGGSLNPHTISALIAAGLLMLYNGKPGLQSASKYMRYMFYAYYPLHLLVLYAATKVIFG